METLILPRPAEAPGGVSFGFEPATSALDEAPFFAAFFFDADVPVPSSCPPGAGVFVAFLPMWI